MPVEVEVEVMILHPRVVKEAAAMVAEELPPGEER
jgi:hypothetical protein